MKRILLVLLLIPALLHAQSDKYMAGAVPEVDGKVVFTRELNVSGFSGEQIYNALLDWSHKTFTENSSRILYTDAQRGVIAAQGEEVMIIKIGLFPGKVKAMYMLTINSSDGKCTLTTSRIRYKNNPSSKDGEEIIAAEEYITDKYALNKTKTKIFRGTGDYRSNTIDIVDRIASEAQNAVYSYNNVAQQPVYAQAVQQPVPQQSVQQPQQTQLQQQPQQTQPQHQPQQVQQVQQVQPQKEVPAKADAPANFSTEGMKSISPVEIPENIRNLASEKGFYITEVGGRKLNNAIAGKGALDISSGKASSMFSLTSNTDNILFLMEMTDNYTLVLLGENNKPVLEIKCKKGQQFDKTFVGEIVEAKIR